MIMVLPLCPLTPRVRQSQRRLRCRGFTVIVLLVVVSGVTEAADDAADILQEAPLQVGVPTAPAAPAAPEAPEAEQHGALWRFGHDTLVDTGSFIVAPLGWDGRDWLIAGGVGVTIVGLGIAFDDNAREESQDDPTSTKDKIASAVNNLGTGASLIYLVGAWAVGETTDSPRATQLARDGLEGTIIASCVIAPAIKLVAGRTRPSEDDPDSWKPLSGNSSFPSGHTTQAFTLASVTAFSFPDYPVAGGVAFALASVVGWARVYGNHHYLSDVLAGAALGTAAGWVVIHENQERREAAGVHLSAGAQSAVLTVVF